jgi:hypothetical protein
MPIKSEIGAVEFSRFEERMKAAARSAAITKKEMPVRIFSCLVHKEPAAPELSGLLLSRCNVEIRMIPR